MSRESPPSSRPSSSTRPALDAQFSSIGDSRPESSNASLRKSWNRSLHEHRNDDDQESPTATSAEAGANNHQSRLRGFLGHSQRSRDHGGFLLDSQLHVSKRRKTGNKTREPVDKMNSPASTERHGDARVGHVSEDSPLGIAFPTDQEGGTTGTEEQDVVESKRSSQLKGKGRLSQPSSQNSSHHANGSRPTSTSAANSQRPSDTEHSQYEKAPAIDPAQIVQMALSLNESRRISLNPGHLAALPSPGNRRAASAGLSPNVRPLQGSTFQPSWAQEQRQASQTGSPGNRFQRKSSSRSVTASPIFLRRRHGTTTSGVSETENEYALSPATLLRAEKARAYMELAEEFRRVLQFLPPLVPSKGTRITSSAVTSGLTSELGRGYNPLQFMRNKKVRAREGEAIDSHAAGWDDPDGVRDWVDRVEADSKRPGFKIDDVAILPEWKEPIKETSVEDTLEPASSNLSGTGPKILKQKRQRFDWSAHPADLFADAYWAEQGNHKALLESSDGTPLFKKFKRPATGNSSTKQNSKNKATTSGPRSSSPVSVPSLEGSARVSFEDSVDEIDAQDAYASRPSPRRTKGSKKFRKVKRLLGRKRDDSISDSLGSFSEGESITMPRNQQGLQIENTGPLERHMTKLLADESRRSSVSHVDPSSPREEDSHGRRGGVSREYQNERQQEDTNNSNAFSADSPTQDFPETPRISVENVDENDDRNIANGSLKRPGTSSTLDSMEAIVHSKPLSKGLGFLRRHQAKEQNRIAEADFARGKPDPKENPIDESGENFEQRAGSLRSFENLAPTATRRRDQDEPQANQDENSTPKRFFKGGRIGELVRNERSPGSEIVSKQAAPRRNSKASSRRRTVDNALSEGEDDDRLRLMATQSNLQRSRSSTDVRKHKFYIDNLPSFVSANSPKPTPIEEVPSPSRSGNATRQARPSEDKTRVSRFERLTNDRSSSDVSPSNSTPDLSRQATKAQQQRRTSDKSPKAPRSRSRDAIKAADKRLNAILREPGRLGTGRLPMTGLAAVDSKAQPGSSQPNARTWSIAVDAIMPEKPQNNVTLRDIAYVQTLLTASGIKARTVVNRAMEAPAEPPKFLKEAADAANAKIPPGLVRSQHFIVAARLLSGDLEKSASEFKRFGQHFKTETSNTLLRNIEDLREKITAELTPLVRSSSDDADGFVAKLTTTHTLAVKQVNDAITSMMRSRQRRLKWMRRAGFALLEWLLVTIMWAIWLFVFLIRALRGIVMGSYKSIRWLLWL